MYISRSNIPTYPGYVGIMGIKRKLQSTTRRSKKRYNIDFSGYYFIDRIRNWANNDEVIDWIEVNQYRPDLLFDDSAIIRYQSQVEDDIINRFLSNRKVYSAHYQPDLTDKYRNKKGYVVRSIVYNPELQVYGYPSIITSNAVYQVTLVGRNNFDRLRLSFYMHTLNVNSGYLLYPDLSIVEITPTNEYISGINYIRSLDRYRGYPVDKVRINMDNTDDIRYRRIKLELSPIRLELLDKTPLMAPIPDDVRYILCNHNIYIVNDRFYYDIDDISYDDDTVITWGMSTLHGRVIDIRSLIVDNGIVTNTLPTLTLFSLYLNVEVSNINLLDYNYPLPPNIAKEVLRDSIRVIKEIHRYINDNYTDPVYTFIDSIVNTISDVERLSDTERSQLRTLLLSTDTYSVVNVRNILRSNYSIDIKKDLIDKFIQYITADTFSSLQYELRDELAMMLSIPDDTKKLLSNQWVSLDRIKDLHDITEKKRLSLIEKYSQLRKYSMLDKNFNRLRDKINHDIHSIDLIDRINKSQLPNYIKDKLLVESKYVSDNDDSDCIKKRQWIDICLKLPTTIRPPPISLGDSIDRIQEFKKSLKQRLNQKVYGMKSVKKLVIDYIFKVLTNPNSNNNHLALCGPKGVGKTYLAQVISEVLDRPLIRVNLGGCHDGSKLVGHSYTYIGSIPGDIIQGLIRSRIMNPIFLLDEVDKISQRHNNEVNGILIHLLDPVQNHEFTDEYLGFPYDISKVLWILSFNRIDNIDPILVDRLHVIHIRGYTNQEKLEMSKTYIIPSIESNLGYKRPLNISQDAIRYIVSLTDNDDGVRRLKHLIETIWTRVNRWIVVGKIRDDDVITIDIVRKILKDEPIDTPRLTYFL